MKKLIVLSILFVVVSCKTVDNMYSYRKLQESVEYDARMKSNQSFTMKSAREDLAAAKEKNKEQEKFQRDSAKVAAVRQKTAELKKN